MWGGARVRNPDKVWGETHKWATVTPRETEGPAHAGTKTGEMKTRGRETPRASEVTIIIIVLMVSTVCLPMPSH